MVSPKARSDNGAISSAATPRDALNQMSEQACVPKQDLLAMAAKNDPFNCGGKAQVEQAEWFANVWNQFSTDHRRHLRKFHYVLISQEEPILKPDGTAYQNTVADWQTLQEWSKFARYLRLVDPKSIVDHRNPDPHLFAAEPVGPSTTTWNIDHWWGFTFPSIETDIYFNFELPEIEVQGYTYHDGDQPVLVELWVEKSTMDDELIPICKDLGINLVTSTGFQSITAAINVLSRASAWAALGRPVRILYLSDFDPAGSFMAPAVARQLEFWHEQYGNDVDIKLTPLGLTREQVEQYQLPMIPIKATDKRKDAFQERHGVDGAVELDALEAIHPGELGQILHDAVVPYRDDDLESRLIDAGAEADKEARSEWADFMDEYDDEAGELAARAQEIVDRYEPRLREIANEFNAEISVLQSESDALESGINSTIESAEQDLIIDLPPRPTAEIGEQDESKWLFDAGRSFFEQLPHYKKHKGDE